MKEGRSLRTILIGVSLIGVGLVLPSRTPEWMRAIPIIAGSATALAGSYALYSLPRQYRQEDDAKRKE